MDEQTPTPSTDDHIAAAYTKELIDELLYRFQGGCILLFPDPDNAETRPQWCGDMIRNLGYMQWIQYVMLVISDNRDAVIHNSEIAPQKGVDVEEWRRENGLSE